MRDLEDKLKTLPYFTRADLRALAYSERSIEQSLYRKTKQKEIIRLKRGVYTTRAYISKIQAGKEYQSYLEFIANILVRSSYITAEYVLSGHELLTESVTSITSYTSSRPNIIINPLGNFRYRNISNSLLGNFETEEVDGFLIKKATKIQALFDYLYMKKKHLREISLRSIEELRLNIHLLSESEIEELGNRIYSSGSKKFISLFTILEKIYVTQRD